MRSILFNGRERSFSLTLSSLMALFSTAMLFSMVARAETDSLDFDLTSTTDVPALTEQTWRISNTFESRNQKFLRQSDWLSARQRLTSQLYASGAYGQGFVSLQADYDPAVHSYYKTTALELYEAYFVFDGAQIALPQTFFTFGKQRITWGATDGRSTIDLLNAINFRDPISNGRTLLRRPSWLMRLEHKTELGIIDLVWMPEGKDRKLPEYGNPWEPAFLNQLRQAERAGLIDFDDKEKHRPEGAARFTHYGQGVDWGFAYFHGYTEMPFAETTGPGNVDLKMQRQRTWNVNAALSLNNSTWRAEAAYTPDMPYYDQNGYVKKSDLRQLILGWDRTFDDNVYGNLQAYWDSYSSGGKDYGVTFAASKPFMHDTLTLGVSGQYGYQGQYSVEAYAEYAFNDDWTFTLRNYYFGGPPESSMGNYADNDFVEFGIRYFF